MKKYLSFSIAAPLIFFLSAIIYFWPVVFENQTIAQDDILMGLAKGREIREFRIDHGTEPLWTNSMFSGMPTFQIATNYPNNWLSYVQKGLNKILIEKSGIYIIISLMLGFFALLRSQKVRPSIAIIGALAFGFSAFFIISLAAGHNAKIRTAVYIAPLLMGVLLTLKGRMWLGFALTALFTGLSIHANHFQITYYTALPIFTLVISFGIHAFQNNELNSWFKRSLVLICAAFLGIGPNFGNLWSSYAYTQESMRGGHSALFKELEDNNSGGLDFDYAMSWSYGIGETINLVIPNATGGGAKQNYENSQIVDVLTDNFSQKMSKAQAKKVANQYAGSVLYFGDQSLVNGGYYIGAIVFLLFIIGLFLVRGPLLWGSLAALIVTFILAWGKHAESINTLIFEYLPLYNKFRVPSMALVIAFVIIPLIGFKGLDILLNQSKEKSLKILLQSTIITGGFSLAIWLLGPTLMGLTGPNDAALANQGFPMDIILNDRKSLLQSSSLQTLLFILLAAGTIWLFILNKIKVGVLAAALGVLIIVDLWKFDKDQLGSDDLITSKKLDQRQKPSATDLFILKDKDPHYRVLNTTVNLTSDAYTSAYHKSIGGYHGAKLARYQDLIDNQMSKGNMAVFSMLNAKWFIVSNGESNTTAQPNANACGHAWFPKEIKLVDSPNDAMTALSDFNPLETAIFESDFIVEDDAEIWTKLLSSKNDSLNKPSINLKNYTPNKMIYSVSDLTKNQLAVFSEIYYSAPYQEWTATADGKPLDIMRTNYILRAAVIPANTKEIIFTFNPITYEIGEKVNLGFSILLFTFLGFAGFSEYRLFNLKKKE
ncbi:MAG: Uncharacterised protein [Owenweeksia sp. TMED14]|nr:MAG: Uncharacterised protein [Owenweeksia sp. TMED14]|tara:strand:+ start:2275 stop:4755 length:2481 start_codon:yes stop_codon:yes gene_type:complete